MIHPTIKCITKHVNKLLIILFPQIISPNDNAPSSLDKPPGLSPSPVVVNSDQPPPPGDDNVQLPINVIGSSNMNNQPHNVNERNVGMGEIPNDAPMKVFNLIT